MAKTAQSLFSDSSQVQPRETTLIPPLPTSYQQYLRRDNAAESFAAELLYAAIDERDNSDLLGLFHSCRTNAWFIRHKDTGELRIASNSCKLRWCPLCANARQNYITAQVSNWFSQVDHPKLLTLTLRHTSSPLKSQIDFLYKKFYRLRQRKFVSSKLYGGVWFFQVKKSRDGKTWHPHIHILMDSEYLDHKKLSQLWSEITGGSYVIDICRVKNPERMVKHLARYCATPAGLVDLPESDRIDLYDAFAKRRLVGCFGTAKKISLRPSKPADSEKWINFGSWFFIMSLAGMHDSADKIIHAWKTGTSVVAEANLEPVENDTEIRPPPIEKPLMCEQYLLDFYR